MSTRLQTRVRVTSPHVQLSTPRPLPTELSLCRGAGSCRRSCHLRLAGMMTGWCAATKEQPHNGDNTATVIAANKLFMPLSSLRSLSGLEMGSLSWL